MKTNVRQTDKIGLFPIFIRPKKKKATSPNIVSDTKASTTLEAPVNNTYVIISVKFLADERSYRRL